MKHDVMLDRLSELARTGAPPPLSPAGEDAMVRSALERAASAPAKSEVPRRRRVPRGALAAAAVALFAAGLAAALVRSSTADRDLAASVPASGGEPMHVELPTGDRLTATPGASFRLTSSEPNERRVALENGTMVFDVARLASGQAFEVETPHVDVRVLGTVFSVTAADEQTIVRVFEGSVMVRDGADRRVVRASQRFSSSDHAIAALDDASPLAAFAWRAAATRAAATEHEEPTVARDTAHADPADMRIAPSEEETRSVPTSVPVASLDPARARALIAEGRAEHALSHARSREGGEWRHIEADSLRALRRFSEAADAYDRASAELDGARAQQAGYLAGSLRLLELGDPAGALASLDRARADAIGSPFEERALVLRVRALRHADRPDDARLAAARYLARYPDGGARASMHALIEAAPSAEALDELH